MPNRADYLVLLGALAACSAALAIEAPKPARAAADATPSTAPGAGPATAQASGKPGGTAAAPAGGKAGTGKVLELDWEELLPQETRLKFQAGPPPAAHDYLGEGGLAAQQVMDFSVNKELNGATVKLPGFIVPLDIGKDGLVSEFFLVPYFGACIHVPPPPPNQIVYVRVDKGIALDSIYEAYWITGPMTVSSKTTRLGAAAYQIAAQKIEIYKY